jgi:heat shock protein 4
VVHAGYAKEAVAALSSQELDMALQDRVARETSDAKNALEGYVYNMRDSLSTRLAPYEKEDVRAAFSKELDGVEVRVCCLKHCLLCTV